MHNRGHLLTEQRNAGSENIDRMTIGDAFDAISVEDRSVAAAVAEARSAICAAVELITGAFRAGGRLIYVGAGTSGRLGVMDAAECPPTFMSDPRMVQGIIAGGSDALQRSVEGAEDCADAGADAMDESMVQPVDIVFGITTGGTTPFVHGALSRAKERGAGTVFLACVDSGQAPDVADVSIRVLVGPEIVTGSTRMKAGTATKMVLNMISTLSMVGIGKVYQNYMVDLNTRGCDKLQDRGVRVVQALTDRTRDEAGQLLEEAHGQVKVALVMDRMQLDRVSATQCLQNHNGHIRAVFESQSLTPKRD